jgi:hypothetical protein
MRILTTRARPALLAAVLSGIATLGTTMVAFGNYPVVSQRVVASRRVCRQRIGAEGKGGRE